MIKQAATVITLAGLACTVSAQNFSLTLIPSSTQIAEGGTFTLSVYGDADVGTHMLGGSFGIECDSPYVSDMIWNPASWSSFNTDNGYAGNGNYNPVIFGQLVIPGVPPFDVPAAGSELGGLIGYYQVSLGNQIGSMHFDLVAQSPFTLEVIDANTGETYQSSAGNLTLNGASITIPAPGSCFLLGLGSLAATRRRR